MVLFLWLKIAINFQKWVYRGMVDIFLLETLRGCPRSLHFKLLTTSAQACKILAFDFKLGRSASEQASAAVTGVFYKTLSIWESNAKVPIIRQLAK